MTSGVGSLAMPRRAAVSETRNSASSKCSDSCMFALLSMLGFALLSNNLKGFSGGGQGDRHAREVLLETEQRHVDVLGRNLHRAANTPGALRGHQRGAAAAKGLQQIGRAWCRERVCQYV